MNVNEVIETAKEAVNKASKYDKLEKQFKLVTNKSALEVLQLIKQYGLPGEVGTIEYSHKVEEEHKKRATDAVDALAYSLGHDTVISPNHYTAGGIETIDYIKAKMTPDQFAGYCTGNILKYISRYPFKNGVEDLKKAKVYLEWLISSEGERL